MALTDNKAKIQALLDGINALPEAGSGEPALQAKTVNPTTSAQTVKPDSGYDGLSQVTVNAMPTATQATPSISVSSGGLITASATQAKGYVAAGTKSATKQLTVQAAQTITPGTSDKSIASGRYLTGVQTIKGDANLKAENIAKGVSIFGVSGTLEAGGSASSGAYSKEEVLTWTPSSTVKGATISHSLGVVPDGFRIVMDGVNAQTSGAAIYNIFGFIFDVKLYNESVGVYMAAVASIRDTEINTPIVYGALNDFCTSSSIKLPDSSILGGPGTHQYPAGQTYEILVYKR